ncbi:hypothetical protein FE257_006026 [Aspergillus nanangensis]|uniref:Zn(2)-C6 fungal-type domain-containing protein n=1 Tax=Aspergillus nanangensis TaxID=2582783 RepID=A0AAD4CPJ3_ASPNN|nr:hypothetical protein FE257_006026 [Aspergillus nanangensis]
MANAVHPGKNPLPAPRSCYRCNQKKIRCSKTQPCDSCVKASFECVFPGPGRAARRKKRPLKAELVNRLSNLEHEFKLLTTTPVRRKSADASSATECQQEKEEVERHQGRLLVEGASTHYVTHEVLFSLQNHIDELKSLVTSSENDEDASGDISDGGEGYLQPGNEFLFGYSSMASSLDTFHPNMVHSQILWKVYEENVAPVITIFHKPSLYQTISKAAANNGSDIDRASEAVVFAVYFAAVNSMSPDQCREQLGQDHSSLLQQYRFATQQALARAGFLHSRNQMVLQAAVLFLTCLRQPGDADFVLTLAAAVYRLAQGLGLHRDGSLFGLSPFEIEMRRRLWWAIYLLDSQTSELHAVDPQITESCYNTKQPLNIDDSELLPGASRAPESRVGFTDMTFSLVRIEMTVRYRRSLLNVPRGGGDDNNNSEKAVRLDERLRQLEQIHHRLREQYLQFCDVSVPVQWVTATIIRLALTRTWLIAHLSQGTAATQIPEISSAEDSNDRDKLFSTAIEVVEFAYLLETDPRTLKWAWLFKGYPQWQAAAFVLSQLCVRPRSADTDQAWAVVNKAVARWIRGDQRGSITRKTIRQLIERAVGVNGYVWDERAGEISSFYSI